MRMERMSVLCRQLDIPRKTFNDWIAAEPELAVRKAGPRGVPCWWVRLDRLAQMHGMSLIDAYLLPGSRWMRASRLAAELGISRKTMNNWCRARPGFARRIGRNYYVDLDHIGVSSSQVDALAERMRRGDLGHGKAVLL